MCSNDSMFRYDGLVHSWLEGLDVLNRLDLILIKLFKFFLNYRPGAELVINFWLKFILSHKSSTSLALSAAAPLIATQSFVVWGVLTWLGMLLFSSVGLSCVITFNFHLFSETRSQRLCLIARKASCCLQIKFPPNFVALPVFSIIVVIRLCRRNWKGGAWHLIPSGLTSNNICPILCFF